MEKGRMKRTAIKARHRLHWKDELREKCLQRVKKERHSLLWKIRSSGQALPASQDVADSTFRTIVTDEMGRMKPTKCSPASQSRTDSDMTIWEYEPSETLSELDPEDYEELMIAMQNILYEEIQKETQQKDSAVLEEFEKVCTEEDRYLTTLLEQLQMNKIGKLEEDQNTIHCSCGHLRLDIQNEKVNLEFLRGRLEELLQQHHDLGCKSQPLFCTDTRFSITALYMQCSSCEMFELVL